MPTTDFTSIEALVTIAGASLAGFGVIGKLLVDSVTKHNEQLPKVVGSLEKIDENQRELFSRMRETEHEVARIGGICEERGKKGKC